MKACGVDTAKGDGLGERVVDPGNPENSAVYQRMVALGAGSGRMPQIGTAIADPIGIAAVEDWINALENCASADE